MDPFSIFSNNFDQFLDSLPLRAKGQAHRPSRSYSRRSLPLFRGTASRMTNIGTLLNVCSRMARTGNYHASTKTSTTFKSLSFSNFPSKRPLKAERAFYRSCPGRSHTSRMPSRTGGGNPSTSTSSGYLPFPTTSRAASSSASSLLRGKVTSNWIRKPCRKTIGCLGLRSNPRPLQIPTHSPANRRRIKSMAAMRSRAYAIGHLSSQDKGSKTPTTPLQTLPCIP